MPTDERFAAFDGDDRHIIPVTDPLADAPDGAVLDGYERQGDQWIRIRPVEGVSADGH